MPAINSNENRILAIDFGEKRIGLAVTDPLNIFAYPLATLPNDNIFLIELETIINTYNVTKIILGDPKKESGLNSPLSTLINEFKTKIENKFKIVIELVDERYSSEIARQRIVEKVSSKKKRRNKSLLDMNSASILLEDYLAKQKYN
ncbi:MAG: Holliday junction resolvase RuvX [Ignavibacteria bacterium]|nr:Holliday junction resolvase RuvX [Ignavibacteria bacterium]